MTSKLTLRDLFMLALVIGLALGWRWERSQLIEERDAFKKWSTDLGEILREQVTRPKTMSHSESAPEAAGQEVSPFD